MTTSIYLDCNATHPLLPAVRQGLAQALGAEASLLMNSASIHRVGQQAKRSVAALKGRLGESLGRGEPDEYVLVSGATEALNLALRAFVDVKLSEGQTITLVSSTVEHSAILDTVADLQTRHPTRITLLSLPVNSAGQLDAEATVAAIGARVDAGDEILWAVQLCNNETGVRFDFEALLPRLYAQFGPRLLLGRRSISQSKNIPQRPQKLWILLDAAQALGKLDPDNLRRAMHYADYAALSAHKMGGPAGIGALWLRPGAPFRIQQTGGSQEKKRRAGTLNAIGVYGFRLALEDWLQNGEAYRAKLRRQKDHVLAELRQIPGVHLHGDSTLVNTLNFHVDGCPEESLLLALDLEGFCLSSGSACHSGSLKASHVLLAMGYDADTALSSLRLCLGVETRDEDVNLFLSALRAKIAHIRLARQRSAELLPEVLDGAPELLHNKVAPEDERR